MVGQKRVKTEKAKRKNKQWRYESQLLIKKNDTEWAGRIKQVDLTPKLLLFLLLLTKGNPKNVDTFYLHIIHFGSLKTREL